MLFDPRNAYAASKVAQEHLAPSWRRLTGGAAIGLRYHNVYGPRMPRDTPHSGVATSALAAAFGDIEPVVTGEYRPGDVRHIAASPATGARDLGFRAQTRFAEGIAEFTQAPLREFALSGSTRL